jgi:hypothetical protein
VQHELVFEEIDPRALEFAPAQKVAVVVQRDFRGRVDPRLVALAFRRVFVDVVQVLGRTPEEVCGTEELGAH